jgi:hypothetical protein
LPAAERNLQDIDPLSDNMKDLNLCSLKHSNNISADLGEASNDPSDHDFASMVDDMVFQV